MVECLIQFFPPCNGISRWSGGIFNQYFAIWDSISPCEGISGWYRWKTNHPHPWGLYTWNDFHCPIGRLVLWAMIIITVCTFSCHLHWIWSRKRFCAKCLAQHLLSPVQQRSHLPVPTLEILGDNSFIRLAQKWCPLEMCKYAWTTMLDVYKLIINVKWMYGWGYI